MKLRSKLTILSICLVVLVAVTSCAILLSYTEKMIVNNIVSQGIEEYTVFYREFFDKIPSDNSQNSLVLRSYLIQTLQQVNGWEKFSLRQEDQYFVNNVGFDIEQITQNGKEDYFFDNWVLKYKVIHLDNADYFVASSPIKLTGSQYSLSFAKNSTEQLDEVRMLAVKCIVTCLILLVAAACVMWIIVRLSLNPIDELIKGANKLKAGDFSNRIYIERKDELSELAKVFNQMAASIQENIESLNNTNERQLSFINGISHELKTPITSIMLNAETILNRNLSGNNQKIFLKRIYDQCKWLERFAQKLMLLVMAQQKIQTENIHASELFSAVYESVFTMLKAKDVSLNIKVNQECFNIDFDLMRSALVNIVVNSIKASQPGQSIDLIAHDNYVEIHDSGCGIPTEALANVKEPFYMVDKSRSPQNDGWGLGLSIVDKIITAHGAQFEIVSELNTGTIVRIIWNPKK